MKTYARSFDPHEEEEEEEGRKQQQHPQPHRAAPIVKAYALLCAFPTKVLMEEGGGEGHGAGFDCTAYLSGISYLFHVSISLRDYLCGILIFACFPPPIVNGCNLYDWFSF